jgi:hypothetical protein
MARLVMSTEFPGTIAATYELDLLPGWRAATPADHAPNAPRPYADLPRWSGNEKRGLPTPPAIGDLVFVTMNGFGYSRVTGYFVEHGWLGCYVKCDKPPDWWVKQNRKAKRKTSGKYGGPMIFGAEMKKEATNG